MREANAKMRIEAVNERMTTYGTAAGRVVSLLDEV